MRIESKKYKEWNIYYLTSEKILLNLAQDIIEKKKLDVKEKYKDTKRNYVVKISYEGKDYVLKLPKNEYRIPQRKVVSLVKKGEALTTLLNISKHSEEGLDIFVKPLMAGVKRKNGMIIKSYILFEFLESIEETKDRRKEMIDLVKKMHEKRIYHGDFNPSNFIYGKDGLKAIDTQGKKFWFGRYRAHYDMLTMKRDSYSEMVYPYKKDIWYFLALSVKKYKRNKFVGKVKEWKKKKRDKGWRI